MRRLIRLVRTAARYPRTGWQGMREFRSDFTPHFPHGDDLETYDAGRELAHILAFRRYDHA